MIKDNSTTIYDAFCNTAKAYSARPIFNVLPQTAQIYDIEAGEITYGEALERIDRFAKSFEAAGYRAGMRVALLLENRPVFFELLVALNSLGISVVPINPDLRLGELSYLIGHCEPALIIAIDSRINELQNSAKQANIDLSVISISEQIPASRENAIVAESNEGEEREAAVLYTSGTTGKPKGCILPNAYFLLAGRWYRDIGGMAQLHHDGERMITPLPIFHMNAMAYSFMAMIGVGGCLTALDRFHPKSWWSDVREAKATCLHYLGVMPSILMNMPETENDKAHKVRFGFGAGVDPKLQAAFETRYNFPLVEAWAMTETGAGAVIAANNEDRPIGVSCLGRPQDDVHCLIVDDEGQEVGINQPGELLVRHGGDNPRYGFFSHYYKDEAATLEAWKGGWFHTGDLVRRDEDGYFYFVDRKKNVIRRSGENIAAVEVESILMRHDGIKAAGVGAVNDEMRGDEVFACLVVDQPSEQLAIEITQWSLKNMAYYKAPGYIAFVDELPLTPTQKIQRAELKALCSSLVDDKNTVKTAHLKKRQQN